jgi:hypothetical protein
MIFLVDYYESARACHSFLQMDIQAMSRFEDLHRPVLGPCHLLHCLVALLILAIGCECIVSYEQHS